MQNSGGEPRLQSKSAQAEGKVGPGTICFIQVKSAARVIRDRKVRVLLNREGWIVGRYLVYRLYKEEGLGLKKRPPRRRKAVRSREERFVATAQNQAWSLGFVADQLQDGKRFRARTIVDVYIRESVVTKTAFLPTLGIGPGHVFTVATIGYVPTHC